MRKQDLDKMPKFLLRQYFPDKRLSSAVFILKQIEIL